MGYFSDAREDAQETAKNFQNEIVEQIIDRTEASNDLFNNYPDGDSYHHENHVDKYYNLQEAAELLGELRNFEETDDGLWEGQMPQEAIATQAAYTYGNAVMEMWQDLIEKINDEVIDIEVDVDEEEKYKAKVKKVVDETIDNFG